MSKYTLTKEFRFEASHQLMHHDGHCARLHGHSWVGEVGVESDNLQPYYMDDCSVNPKANMVKDYADIKEPLKKIVSDFLDHHHLNETLKSEMPTSEFVAKRVFDLLKPDMPELAFVTIKETCTSSCTYRGNNV